MKRHLILALVSLMSVACVVEEEPTELPNEQEPAEDAPVTDDGAEDVADDGVEPLQTLQPGEPMDAPSANVRPEAAIEPACIADDDCGESAWCGKDVDGVAVCREYKLEGESCGSYSMPGMAEQCAAGLVCVVDPTLPDLPGWCDVEANC